MVEILNCQFHQQKLTYLLLGFIVSEKILSTITKKIPINFFKTLHNISKKFIKLINKESKYTN